MFEYSRAFIVSEMLVVRGMSKESDILVLRARTLRTDLYHHDLVSQIVPVFERGVRARSASEVFRNIRSI